MDIKELRELLKPIEYECPICNDKYQIEGDLRRCLEQHVIDRRRQEMEEKKKEQAKPDEALVSLLETLGEEL